MQRFILARITTVGLIGVIAVAAVLLGPDDTGAAAPTSQPSTDLPRLQQERIATLRQAADLVERQFTQGVATADEVSRWHRELLQAELESAGSAEDRLRLLRKAVDAAKKHEELATRNYQAGVAPALATFETKAYRLRVEIQLAQSTAPSGR